MYYYILFYIYYIIIYYYVLYIIQYDSILLLYIIESLIVHRPLRGLGFIGRKQCEVQNRRGKVLISEECLDGPTRQQLADRYPAYTYILYYIYHKRRVMKWKHPLLRAEFLLTPFSVQMAAE